MKNYKYIIICSLVFIFYVSCSTPSNFNEQVPFTSDWDPTEKINFSRLDIINDMHLPSEGLPAGVPGSYDWKYKPRLNYGINPPKGWNAVLAWGQVYAYEKQPNPNKDFPLVRVHLKDIQLYVYRNDGSWKLVQNDENPQGFSYIEDFTNDKHKPTKIQYEEGGGISIQAGSGYNFHFWPSRGRNRINTNDIRGIFAVCKARLIGTENYSSVPKYLMNMGADYWRDVRVAWRPGMVNNDDIGIGRFKFITTEWQYFTMHTFSKEEAEKIVFPMER